MKKSFSLFEQASISAGSFLFFVFAARMLGSLDFGKFAAFLVPAQIVHSIGVQWILLPITTTIEPTSEQDLLQRSLRRSVFLGIATPLISTGYAFLIEPDVGALHFAIVVVFLTMVMITFDILRYFAIRLDQALLQTSVNIVRWGATFAVFLFLQRYGLDEPIRAVISFISGICAGILVSSVKLPPVIRAVPVYTGNTNEKRDQDGRALLSLGLANALFNLTTSVALARISLPTLGAMQAFRSLVNWVPVILQYFETHFASGLVRRGATSFTSAKLLLSFFAVGAVGQILIYVLGALFIHLSVGSEFAEFKWLLGAVFAHVLIQGLIRVIGIEVRLEGANRILWQQSIFPVAGVLAIVISGLVSNTLLIPAWIVGVMIAVATLQAISMTTGVWLIRATRK